MPDNNEIKHRPKRKTSLLKTIVYAVIIIVVVTVGLLAFIMRDSLNADALRRIFTYVNVSRSDSGTTDGFTFERDNGNIYRAFDDGLIVVSGIQVSMYTRGGGELFTEQIDMDAPTVVSSEKIAAVYDSGGTHLLVFTGLKTIWDYESPQPIITASVNDSGWLTLVTRESGYKSLVTVYDSGMNEVYKWYAASGYVVSADISPDCRYLAVASVGQKEEELSCRAVVFELSEENEHASFEAENQLLLQVRFMDKTSLCLVGEDSAIVINTEGEESGRYDYSGLYLDGLSASGDGFLVLKLDYFQNGKQGRFVTVDESGHAISALEYDEEIIAFSAAGEYVAVLKEGAMDIYRKNLRQYGEIETESGTKKVEMRSDGTAFLLSAGSAKLFIP